MSATPPASGSRGPTPPPGGAGGVSPLVIGKSFVKQYYQVLSTSPEHIAKFYKPNSVLSQGDASTPSTPSKFAAATSTENVGATLKERLLEEDGARIELGQGAIDAQESVGGGVLLVVTGHMVLEAQAIRKSFCHTFFLNPLDPQAKKKHYYIHNDVLRFLHQEALSPSPAAAAAASTAATEQEAVSEAPTPSPDEAPVEEPSAAPHSPEPVVSIEEPPLGVEETKNEPPKEEPAKPATEDSSSPSSQKEKKDKKEKRSRSRGRRSKSRSSSPTESSKNRTAAKPVPNSWASLVAAPAPPVNKQTKPAKEKTATKQSTPAATDTTPAEQPSSSSPSRENNKQSGGGGGGRSVKRDPENTLVIKNVLEGTKEAEIRGLFEPLARKTKAKILGITVAGHRGLAFVDYDSPKPVAMALDMQQKKERFRLNGRNLDVEPKSTDHRMKKGSSSSRGGGYNRSGSPGNGGRYNRGDRKSGRGGGGSDRAGRGGRGGK